jgi:hypothetical protein
MAVVTQIQVRRGTASQWTSTNPTLAAGEWGFETDTGKAKIGNGSSTWTSLSYFGGAGDVTLNGVQTLTNKTLTAPIITIATNAQAASYTLVLTDQSDLVEINNASANTLTVPLDSSVAFPIGTTVTILQTGAGQTTITPTGGVTINGTPGLKLRAQWSSATLIKRATDTWVAIGDLSA